MNETDEKIVIGGNVGKEVTCSECSKSGTTDTFFTYQNQNKEDVVICPECRSAINTELEKETQGAKMFGAVGLAIVAAIIGGIVWYYIAILTGYEIGYLGLGLGYLIGGAVYFGSGKKRNHKLQIVAAIVAFLAIFFIQYFIFNHYLTEYVHQNLDQFPEFTLEDSASLPLFNGIFLQSFLSPIGIIIYALALYVAYRFPKPRKI